MSDLENLRRERDAARAHASHWRREVAALVGVQSEGMADSDLLALLKGQVEQVPAADSNIGTVERLWQLWKERKR